MLLRSGIRHVITNPYCAPEVPLPTHARQRRMQVIIRGRRGVTPDTALRLARVVGMSADFWLGLQQDWDLWHAMRSDNAAAIAELEPLRPTE